MIRIKLIATDKSIKISLVSVIRVLIFLPAQNKSV